MIDLINYGLINKKVVLRILLENSSCIELAETLVFNINIDIVFKIILVDIIKQK